MAKTLLLQNHSMTNVDLFETTLPNHARYVDSFAYDMLQLYVEHVDAVNDWHDYVRTAFGGMPWLDTIVTVGSDVVFTDMSRGISTFFPEMKSGAIISEECIGGSQTNADLIIWRRGDALDHLFSVLDLQRKRLLTHVWGMQEAFNEIHRDRARCDYVMFAPVRMLQSTHVHRGGKDAWQKGDFSIHFLGESNADKERKCGEFLDSGTVLWRHG